MAFYNEQRILRQTAHAGGLKCIIRGKYGNRHISLEPRPAAVRCVAEVNGWTDSPPVCRWIELSVRLIFAKRGSYEQVEAREGLGHKAGERLTRQGRSTKNVYLPEKTDIGDTADRSSVRTGA